MAKNYCPNGHIYDSSIYGDNCPLCPQGGGAPADNAMPGKTKITTPTSPVVDGNTHGGFSHPSMNFGSNGLNSPATDPTGETHIHGNSTHSNTASAQASGPKPGATMIRPPKGGAKTNGRKLVGFLVSYNRYPLGKAFSIYEGKNYIGRDASADICIPDDSQISGRHMMILYRNIDNKFKYRDEQSSNGTFVNKQLSDEGELENYDIIRLGNTVFTFIAIPQV